MKTRTFALGLALLTVSGCAIAAPAPPTASSTVSTPPPVVTATPSPGSGGTGAPCEYRPFGTPARTVDPPPSTDVPDAGAVTYTLSMSSGDVVVTLDRAAAPCTVNSFEALAKQGYFDKTDCHRVTDSGGLFVLQCGDPTGTGSGGPGYQFDDELSGDTAYPAGTLAMANAGPDTNGSQFFVVYADSELPPAYTVFGHTDQAGVQVVAGIAAGGHDQSFGTAGGGKPLQPARINAVVAG